MIEPIMPDALWALWVLNSNVLQYHVILSHL